jgi:hypothetical protein
VRALFDPLADLPERVGDVAHDLRGREVHPVDRSRAVVDVQDVGAAWLHEERRLLHDVVTDVDDQVGVGDRVVQVIFLG